MKRNTKILIIGILITFVVFFLIGRYSQPVVQPEQKVMTHADSVFEAQYAEYEADLNKDTACVRKGCNIPTLGGFIEWKEYKAQHR